MKEILASVYNPKIAPGELKQYSIWLANFADEREKGAFDIELPGTL